MTIVAEKFDHVIGVDTHAKTHTLVVLNPSGVLLKADTFPTSGPGLRRAQNWIGRNAPGEILVAMEGTGSYGAQFAQLLENAGIVVAETKPPKRGARRNGKSDEIDAELAARFALFQPVEKLLVPRRNHGDRTAIQVLLVGRRYRTHERTAAVNRLTALLRIHDLGVDARRSLAAATIDTISHWRPRVNDAAATAVIRTEATEMAARIRTLDAELTRNETALKNHVTALACWLLDEFGIGPVTAAQLLASWSHKDRVRNEAAFARLGGVAPIPASSGNIVRHRVHRGGDRQLNYALWVIANSRTMNDPATKPYVERRIAEGKNRDEILRSLKRYIARSLFRKLQQMS